MKNIFYTLLSLVLLSSASFAADANYAITTSYGFNTYTLGANGESDRKLNGVLYIDFTTLVNKNIEYGVGFGIDTLVLNEIGVSLPSDLYFKNAHAKDTLTVVPIYLVGKYNIKKAVISAKLGFTTNGQGSSYYSDYHASGDITDSTAKMFIGLSAGYALSDHLIGSIDYTGYRIENIQQYKTTSGGFNPSIIYNIDTNHIMQNKIGLSIAYKLDIPKSKA